MKFTKLYKYLLFILFFMLFFIYIIFASFLKNKIIQDTDKYSLKKDGFVVLKNVFDNIDVQYLKNKCIENDYSTVKNFLVKNNTLHTLIHNQVGKNYVFQDYIWIIQKSSVHTCHRDNNGDFFNEGQKYPSYTMLIYLESMDKCLGVVPTSHKNLHSFDINLINPTVHLPCKSGDIILFNANLIHVGTLHDKEEDHIRIQMKVSHKEDIKVLSYYENFNKVLNKDNKLPFFIKNMQQNVSCMFPIFSNLTQKENIRSSRGSDNGVQIGWFQQLFSYLFYGNSNFYDLPNAF